VVCRPEKDSHPSCYTTCPNPFLGGIIEKWQQEREISPLPYSGEGSGVRAKYHRLDGGKGVELKVLSWSHAKAYVADDHLALIGSLSNDKGDGKWKGLTGYTLMAAAG
jgi:hypothetical protein